MVFENESRTVYSDWCCHLDEHGLKLLARFIAREIVAGSSKLAAMKTVVE